ncbi:aquaporin-7-like [Uloborus diversus]|uniref:aquaporin-7-like n=1 Tax=Uloborus diversus TaxID=327109 RepID=UPI00240974AC|nr:aquaporin-7-like [Uloborus diversus]
MGFFKKTWVLANPGYGTWLQKFRIKNEEIRQCTAEFFGTFILVMYGDLTLAMSILGGQGVPDALAATWAWGVGIILGITVSGSVSGGHINPAVTLAFASVKKLPLRKVFWYFLGQYLGGFIASVFVFLTYYDAFNNYDPDRTVVGLFRTAHIFATYPKDGISIWNCFLGEVIAGFLVMFIIMAVVDKKNMHLPLYLEAIFIGLMVQTTLLAFGLNCMAPLNPARDLPPRIFTVIAGWGTLTFSIRNYGYFWIGIIGPHLGCILGAWAYYLAIEIHFPEKELGKDCEEPAMSEAKLTSK